MPAILHAAKYRDNRNRLGMSFESVAPELAQIAETISAEFEAACDWIDDEDGNAAVGVACVNGISQIVLALRPLQMAALDAELAAALAKT